MGAALVALCLLSGDLGAQASLASSRATPGESAFAPGVLALQASVASELRVGVAPVVPGAESEAFVAEILIPRLALELRNPGLAFSAWYAPRIFWEDPHPPAASGTLILHTFGLTFEARRFRDIELTASAGGSIGEPDYTTLTGVLGTAQPTLPPVIDIAAVDGQARVAARLTERWGASLAGKVAYWQWLDPVPGTVTPGTVTNQTSVSGEPAVGFRLTPRDALGLGTTFGWVSYSYGAGAFTVSPATTWKRRLEREAELNVRLGMTYVHALGSPPPGVMPLLGVGRTEAISPIGSADVVLHLARRDEILF